jgi:hypothetical protein
MLQIFAVSISKFNFIVTAHSFRLFSDLLFFLSKKVSKKGHRRPRLNDAVGQGLHPGGGGFLDLALVLLWLQLQ